MEDNKNNERDEKSILGNWIKLVANKLNPYASLIVALATVALVFVTYFHIQEAKQMRNETKRLVDVTVDQFKIKSYPTLKTETPKIHIESDKLIYEFIAYNGGEITAFKMTALLVLVFASEKESKKVMNFQYVLGAIYENEKEVVNTMNFERKVLHKGKLTYKYKTPLATVEKLGGIDKLRKALFYIRFKVPYDDKYSYEESSYTLKAQTQVGDEKNKTTYKWQAMDTKDTENLNKRFLKTLGKKNQDIHEIFSDFFKDYQYWNDVLKKGENVSTD